MRLAKIIRFILILGEAGDVLSVGFPWCTTTSPSKRITSHTSAFQSVSSSSARQSVFKFKFHCSVSEKSISRNLRRRIMYLNSSDGARNENSDHRHMNFLSDGCYPDDNSVRVSVQGRIIDIMSGMKDVPTSMLTFCAGAFLFGTTALFPDVCLALVDQQQQVDTPTTTTTTTTTTNKLKRTSRYWSMIESSDQTQIMDANENLMDQAVGTINTMYYDNSGGADFSPKDVYDRWKVLRTYAKEGEDGVRAINNNIALKQQQQQQSKHQQNTVPQQQAATRKDDPFYGNGFSSQLFTVQKNSVQLLPRSPTRPTVDEAEDVQRTVPPRAFDTRERAVVGLKWLVSTLGDPYSKYLTREELREELQVRDYSFLGLGAIVEPPPRVRGNIKSTGVQRTLSKGQEEILEQSKTKGKEKGRAGSYSAATILTLTRVANLPVVTAIVPDSPAERAGIVVGDRFAAIGTDKLIGLGRDEVIKKLSKVYTGADNYIGNPDVTVAKPILRALTINSDEDTLQDTSDNGFGRREDVVGYKLSRVRLPTMSVEPFKPYTPSNILPQITESHPSPSGDTKTNAPSSALLVSGGDSIVHYQLLTPDDSIFRRFTTLARDTNSGDNNTPNDKDSVGYIRITRFSRSATEGYINAVNELEKAGAKSYIIDVRNNYGGVIQESMLTAASLLRDPHAVLCYTMNSRGGFTPHDSEEYIVDKRYPGYLLSSEKPSVTLQQVKRDNPEFVNENGSLQWYPPSSYASLREQRVVRGIRPASSVASANAFELDTIVSGRQNLKRVMEERKQLSAQKNIVLLVNEGTASAAEVFVSSLHDNGRTVATVGTRTYGKGLIQHTFPMPDGGGLRLTVAEYLTPALQHVTKVGNARYDPRNGDVVRGGIRPDIYCASKQGIPSNAGADLCVGIALDALEDADVENNTREALSLEDNARLVVGRRGGADGGSAVRRTITQGVVKDTY